MKLDSILLNESSSKEKLQEFYSDIYQKCIVSPLNIFRGDKDFKDDFGIKIIRQDRKPQDTSGAENIIFNYFFWLAYGIKDIRKKVLFGTTSRHSASDYGYSSSGFYVGAAKSPFLVYPLKSARLFVHLDGDSRYLLRDFKSDFVIDLAMMPEGGEWATLMKSLYNYESPQTILLQTGEYLSDVVGEKSKKRLVPFFIKNLKQACKEVNIITKPAGEVWIYDTKVYMVNFNYMVNELHIPAAEISELRRSAFVKRALTGENDET